MGACTGAIMVIILILVSLGTGWVHAEKGIQVLRLKDAIQKALDQNPDLKSLKFEALRMEAEAGPKGSYEDPMLSFEAMNYPVDSWNARDFGMTGRQVSLIQKIPFPGKLSKQSRAMLQKYEAAREKFFENQLNLIKSVKVIFFELSLAYKKKDILQEQKKLIHQMVAIARSKFTLGKMSQAELLNFQVEEAGLLEQLLGVEKEIRSKGAELWEIMGYESDFKRPEEIQKTLIDLSQIEEQKILEKILAKNPKLKAAEREKESSETLLSSAKWGYLPDFELMASYTFRLPNPDDRGTDVMSGRIGMTLPLWAISKQSHEVKAARLDLLRSEAMVDGARLFLKKSVRSIIASIKEAHEKLRLYEGGLLQMTEQAVQSGKSAYLTGKIEYATLLNSINTRFKTEYNYFETVIGHEITIAELEALLAEPVAAQ